jgi:hypothetical protein
MYAPEAPRTAEKARAALRRDIEAGTARVNGGEATRKDIHDEIVRQTGREFYSPPLHGGEWTVVGTLCPSDMRRVPESLRKTSDGVALPAPTDAELTLIANGMTKPVWGIGSRREDAIAFARAVLDTYGVAVGVPLDEAGIRADEREACARIAEDEDHRVEGRGHYDQLGDANATQHNIVKAIRARGVREGVPCKS